MRGNRGREAQETTDIAALFAEKDGASTIEATGFLLANAFRIGCDAEPGQDRPSAGGKAFKKGGRLCAC